jgi:hypothetical protein
MGRNKKEKQSDNQVATVAKPANQKCCFCVNNIKDSEDFMFCYTCHKSMHCVCWDPDVPEQVLAYLVRASCGNAGLRVYCATCAISTVTLETRVQNIEAQLAPQQPAKSYASVTASSSSAPTSNMPPVNAQVNSFQYEIAEALEQEKRKKNVIIYNLTSSNDSDTSRVESLLVHVTGNPPPALSCRRLGKIIAGKTRPVLVEFSHESDVRYVLRQAHHLKNMQTEWPHVSIAPDRTKKQQEAYRQLRSELRARRNNGERLIIFNDRLVPDKRCIIPPAPVNASVPSADSSPLRVVLPPLPSQDSTCGCSHSN